MPKQSITNTSPGPRSINCVLSMDKDGKPVPYPVALMPGETDDLEVFNEDDPVFKGLKAIGDIVVGAVGSKPELPGDRLARLQADSMDLPMKLEAARQAGRQEVMVELDTVKTQADAAKQAGVAKIAELQAKVDGHDAQVAEMQRALAAKDGDQSAAAAVWQKERDALVGDLQSKLDAKDSERAAAISELQKAHDEQVAALTAPPSAASKQTKP